MKKAILTIEQIKNKVRCQSREFLSSHEAIGLTYLKNDILEEIKSCGFCGDMLGITDIIVPLWSENLDSYILAVRGNTVNIEIKRSAEVALLGLLHLLDLTEFAQQITGIQQRT